MRQIGQAGTFLQHPFGVVAFVNNQRARLAGLNSGQIRGQLDGFNLNSFALFASEEALMETMAMRELYFRGAGR